MKNFNVSDYIREKYRQVVLKFDKEKDRAVISKLEEQDSMTAYVRYLISKDLIREDTNNGEEAEQI